MYFPFFLGSSVICEICARVCAWHACVLHLPDCSGRLEESSGARSSSGGSSISVRGAGGGMREDRASSHHHHAAAAAREEEAAAAHHQQQHVHFLRFHEPQRCVCVLLAGSGSSPGEHNIGQRLAAAACGEWTRSQDGPHRQGPGSGYPVRRRAHPVPHQLRVPEEGQPLRLPPSTTREARGSCSTQGSGEWGGVRCQCKHREFVAWVRRASFTRRFTLNVGCCASWFVELWAVQAAAGALDLRLQNIYIKIHLHKSWFEWE